MLRRFNPDDQFRNAHDAAVWEALGRVSTSTASISVARLELPSGPLQPLRRNRFDETLIVVSGQCIVEVEGTPHSLQANDVLYLPAGTAYREQAVADGCLAWAVCMPAYQFELVEFLE